MILAHTNIAITAPRNLGGNMIDEVSVLPVSHAALLPHNLRDIGEPAWISCYMASPHVDLDYAADATGVLFLTLAVRSRHAFGSLDYIRSAHYDWGSGDRDGSIGIDIPPGTLFVVDPMSIHWLSPPTGPLYKFVALQWIVERRVACKTARTIVEALDAQWAPDSEMGRYKRWRPR